MHARWHKHASSRYNEVVSARGEKNKDIFGYFLRRGKSGVVGESTEVQSRPLVDRVERCVGTPRGSCSCGGAGLGLSNAVTTQANLRLWAGLSDAQFTLASDKSLVPLRLSLPGEWQQLQLFHHLFLAKVYTAFSVIYTHHCAELNVLVF